MHVVRRLYRILALRGMGFPLGEIAAVLVREGEDPRPAVRRHLERVDGQLRLARTLRRRLTRILELLDRSDERSGDQFIEAIEVMTRMERYYTPEQADQLEARAAALGEDGLRRAEADWAEPIAAVESEPPGWRSTRARGSPGGRRHLPPPGEQPTRQGGEMPGAGPYPRAWICPTDADAPAPRRGRCRRETRSTRSPPRCATA